MRLSLRVKVALGFSALTIVLLAAQALGVRVLAERQEERLIDALIHDDIENVVRGYEANPALLPPFDARLSGYVSSADRPVVALPASVAQLPAGTHEIIVDAREIHVAIAPLRSARLYRTYNFSRYEQHFKAVVDALMVGTGAFSLLTLWLSFGLSGLLVRQVAGFARQVKALRHDAAAAIDPAQYDEDELVGLVDAFNRYHRRMADMIEREKAFAGNVSHELRTPLTAIATSCELLEQDPAIAGKSRARLEQIERAASAMREQINALLLLARDESAARVDAVKLADAIRDALQPFADALREKGVETIVDVGESTVVMVNAAALAIVLSNLIDNAARYTDAGHLRFAWEDGRLLIEDTGRGIDPQALPHVFDRFYRADAQALPLGFGIGLSVVHRIVERYGWAIDVDSEPKRGTRVFLRLPTADAGSSAPAHALRYERSERDLPDGPAASPARPLRRPDDSP